MSKEKNSKKTEVCFMYYPLLMLLPRLYVYDLNPNRFLCYRDCSDW
jgi:hypothetical protein